MNQKQFKIVSLTALGGALEFYDFTIYALFAPYLSIHFFPNSDHLVSLINTFAVFALGYFARPLGGILFGHVGDKWGRKSAFTLAILLMAISTLLMGCLPSYSSIGLMAPIFLIALRLLQGFSVGGEIPGATIFTLEHVAISYRGFAVGLVFMCVTLGNSLGALVGFIASDLFGSENMMAWGWRIPFILGFFLGLLSFIIRLKALETPIFKEIAAQGKLQRRPFLTLIKTAPSSLLIAFLLTATSATFVSFFLYLPSYFSNIWHFKILNVYLINSVSFLVLALMTTFSGWFSDYAGKQNLLFIGSLLIIFSAYALFSGLTHFGESFIWVFSLSFALVVGIINGCYGAMIAESFPANVRYSGMGFSYNLGFATFGGLAPLLFTFLIKVTQDIKAPCFYILICALCTLAASFLYKKSAVS